MNREDRQREIKERHFKLAKYLIVATLYYRPEMNSGGLDFVASTGGESGGEDALIQAVDRYFAGRTPAEFVRRPGGPPDESFTLDVGTLAVAIGRPGSVFIEDARWTAQQVAEALLRFEGWRFHDGKQETWENSVVHIDPARPAANANYRDLIRANWMFMAAPDRRAFDMAKEWYNANHPTSADFPDTPLEGSLR